MWSSSLIKPVLKAWILFRRLDVWTQLQTKTSLEAFLLMKILTMNHWSIEYFLQLSLCSERSCFVINPGNPSADNVAEIFLKLMYLLSVMAPSAMDDNTYSPTDISINRVITSFDNLKLWYYSIPINWLKYRPLSVSGWRE